MSLVRLTYASRFAYGSGPNDVQDILRVSREHNEKIGITGALCYDPKFFLQCLEGDRVEVNRLYADILADDRHKSVMLLEYSEIRMRLFSNWSMAYVRIDEMTKPILLKFSTKAVFDPYAMTGPQCAAFIKEVAEERQQYLQQQIHHLKKEEGC